MRHIIWLATVALITLAVSACGGGAGGEQQATGRPLPAGAQDLRPGEYRTEVFKPALSFTVGKGWALECCAEGPDHVSLHPSGEQTLFKFVNVAEVYKPSELIDMSGETTPPPADPVGWFEQHPYLQTDKPEPVTVGGIKGQQFDVVIGDLPKDYPEGLCAPSNYVQLTVGSVGEDWAVEEGNKDRVTVLEDVKGQEVIIDFGSPATEFDEYWPEAEKVVQSVKWKGS